MAKVINVAIWQDDELKVNTGNAEIVYKNPPTEEITIYPSTIEQEIYPSTDKYINKVIVKAVTSDIDSNITSLNIRKGVSILGVEGNLEPDKPDQSKSVQPTEQEQIVVADTGFELAKVTVGAIPNNFIGSAITRKGAETFEFSEEDRTINEGQYLEGSQLIKGAKLQDKVVTPNEEQQTISNDSEFNALKSVTVNAIPSDYVASGVERRSEQVFEFSTQDREIPANVYLTGSQTIKGAVLQSKEITPNEQEQIINADNNYNALQQVKINAIPSNYVGSQVPREQEQTITPTTTNQVIPQSTYLEGQQIILGDENLVPKNIAQGVDIFGVVGTAQTATRDENETMYEMQEIDYMRFLSSEISYYDIPTSSEYQTQQTEVNQIINQLIGEEFNG